MSEQELWDKFIEMYRHVWSLPSCDRTGNESAIYYKISADTHWEIFDSEHHDELRALGEDGDLYKVRLRIKESRWDLLVNTPAWPFIEQHFPGTVALRLLYV